MQKGLSRPLAMLLASLALLLIWMPALQGNAAEPPNIIVILQGESGDLNLSILMSDGTQVDPTQRHTAWERQWVFEGLRHYGAGVIPESLQVTRNGSTHQITLPETVASSYNSILTYDAATQALLEGKRPLRSVSLVALRVMLTLVIEGLIFYAFGYRSKRHWLVFLAVNLLTQGFVNMQINAIPLPNSYTIFALVAMEILVLAIEMGALIPLLRERSRRRAALFTLAANVASTILGGFMLRHLPI